MATHIISLGTYPSMRDAFAVYTRLLTEFKAVHKRAEKVDLFLSLVNDAAKPGHAEIRLHHTKEHEAEARWFEKAAANGGAK